MRNLERVSCSLNLGLIYNLEYSYSPDSGVSVTLFFVNDSGEYSKPNMLPLQKAHISIGGLNLSLYPKQYKISKSSGRRIMQVEFVDETFLLDNYYIVLTGRGGRGRNIYELGSPVDKRSSAQKINDALDKEAQNIKEFTEFQDLEYKFDDFLLILKRHFPVSINATYDATITRPSVGSFRSVLSDWCGFYNLSFYFENSQIKICDPTTLNISLPQQPQDAISFEESESIEGTYTKTVSNYFQQEGGEKELTETLEEDAETGDTNSAGGSTSNTIKYLNLLPPGYEFNLPQTSLDLNQVAAAMYGEEFWFLYNLANDTLGECGWTKKNGPSYFGYLLAEVDEQEFREKFNAYFNYGQNIAGKWYLSSRVDDLTILMDTRWFSEADGQVFDMNSSLAEERAITPIYLEPADFEINKIKDTVINEYFPGINFVGKRVAFYDSKDNGKIAAFTLTDEVKDVIKKTYRAYVPTGNESMDFSNLPNLPSNKVYVGYNSGFISESGAIPPEIGNLFDIIKKGDMRKYFLPRYANYPIKGVRLKSAINQKDLKNQPKNVRPISNDPTPLSAPSTGQPTPVAGVGRPSSSQGQAGPQILSNTSVIKVKKEGTYSVYYDKYSNCVSASSSGDLFGHRYEPRTLSGDAEIKYTLSKRGDIYILERDLSEISLLLNNPFLQSLAQGRTFPTKTVSFTLNYFYNVPLNFLSNGLVSMQMSVSENGVMSSYTFSNGVFQIPNVENDFIKYEQNIKNSWIRKYTPKDVVTL